MGNFLNKWTKNLEINCQS